MLPHSQKILPRGSKNRETDLVWGICKLTILYRCPKKGRGQQEKDLCTVPHPISGGGENSTPPCSKHLNFDCFSNIQSYSRSRFFRKIVGLTPNFLKKWGLTAQNFRNSHGNNKANGINPWFQVYTQTNLPEKRGIRSLHGVTLFFYKNYGLKPQNIINFYWNH